MTDDHRTTPGAGGAGHISGVGPYPYPSNALTAPSAGTGDGQAVYEECARIASHISIKALDCSQHLKAIGWQEACEQVEAAIRSAAKAAPSPSRREPTSEEIVAEIDKLETTWSVDADNKPVHVGHRYRSREEIRAAVLALLDRAGKE